MEAYGKILLIAMPAFLLLVLFEKWWGWHKGNDTVPINDMISSLSSGITNATKDVLGLSVAIISYGWLVEKVAITHIQSGWLTYVVAFIALDFAGYWVHRISHEYNLFWNNHIIHHSSEEFNLACALRQSISSIVRIFAIFLLPAALLGVPQQVIAIVAPLHLFAQFWYHTQHIGKMGFLEHIIVTPSHHRVHHAINSIYLDRNYSQIFIIWDKLFGTFQQELADVPPVYGVTRPVQTWNPIKINFMHLWLLIKDAWRAQRVWDKLRIWFMPLGWRPANLPPKPPLVEITQQNQQRLVVKTMPKSKTYLILSAIFGVALMMLIISPQTIWTTWERIIGSVLLWHLIVNWSGILESKRWLFSSEIIRIVLTIPAIYLFSNLSEKPVWLAVLVAYHLYCLVWTVRYFKLT